MANKFDRIIQENFEGLTMSLLNRIMQVKKAEIIYLPRKVQRTFEREMDTLLKIVSPSGHEGLLDIEWQTTNDSQMCYRMLLYHAISAIVYRLPVISVVVYIGKEKMNMKASIEEDNLKYKYRLLDFTSLNPEMFLQSNIPSELIMAILAGKNNYGEKREIIRRILFKLHALLKDDTQELGRRLRQFETIGELRAVQKIIIEEEKNMAITYNLKKDIRYNQGLEKGIEKGIKKGFKKAFTERNTAFVEYLLQNTSHPDEQIAVLVNVPLDFVLSVKQMLKEE